MLLIFDYQQKKKQNMAWKATREWEREVFRKKSCRDLSPDRLDTEKLVQALGSKLSNMNEEMSRSFTLS